MIQVIDITQRKEWEECVSRASKCDFYHSWTYHSMDRSGTPLLCVYNEGQVFIAFPLIKRRIDNSPYFDLTSVYGYPGPISNLEFNEMTDELIENFKNSFLQFLQEGDYVTVFTRLNPFLNQNRLVDSFGGLHPNGNTVVIDLQLPEEDQRAGYRRTHLQTIRQLKARGFVFHEVKAETDIRAFADIYRENMIRVNSCKSLFFDDEYFQTLLHAEDYLSKLFMIYFKDLPVSGAVFTFSHGIMQIHLLATKTEFLKFSPAKLIVDGATLIGRQLNMRHCHLGGGLGFKEDQLFSWKCGFSKQVLDYYSWRFIANENIYNLLVSETCNDKNFQVDFFPLYRYNPPVNVPSVESTINLIS